METFDNESFIIKSYRMIPSSRIVCFGNYFRCLRIKRLTKSIFYKKSWINSSSKKDIPPDFYNIKHSIMMEVMRVDDCIETLDGKPVNNSFKKASLAMKKCFGKDYKTKRNDISLYFSSDTSNSDEFNFSGYLASFERVIMKHSKKADGYRKNHPECKDLVFFVFDESNCYVQVSNKKDLLKEGKKDLWLNNAMLHRWYNDAKFLEIIKKCNADFFIWFCWCKTLYVNGKEIRQPIVCIFDVKNLKNCGIEYNHQLMLKITEEQE